MLRGSRGGKALADLRAFLEGNVAISPFGVVIPIQYKARYTDEAQFAVNTPFPEMSALSTVLTSYILLASTSSAIP